MDIEQTKKFLLAGNATITIKSTITDKRYTFKMSQPGFLDEGKYFVALLGGPNNECDYNYMGIVNTGSNGPWYLSATAKSKFTTTSKPWMAFAWFIGFVAAGRTPPNCQWWHEGACGRCGRKLTVPSSIEMGLGPYCAGVVQ